MYSETFYALSSLRYASNKCSVLKIQCDNNVTVEIFVKVSCVRSKKKCNSINVVDEYVEPSCNILIDAEDCGFIEKVQTKGSSRTPFQSYILLQRNEKYRVSSLVPLKLVELIQSDGVRLRLWDKEQGVLESNGERYKSLTKEQTEISFESIVEPIKPCVNNLYEKTDTFNINHMFHRIDTDFDQFSKKFLNFNEDNCELLNDVCWLDVLDNDYYLLGNDEINLHF